MKSDPSIELIDNEDVENKSLSDMFTELLNNSGNKKYPAQTKELFRQRISLAKESDAEGIGMSLTFDRIDFVSWLYSNQDLPISSFIPEFSEILSKILFHCNVTFFEIVLQKYALFLLYYLYLPFIHLRLVQIVVNA